jgi:hypothetical protein
MDEATRVDVISQELSHSVSAFANSVRCSSFEHAIISLCVIRAAIHSVVRQTDLTLLLQPIQLASHNIAGEIIRWDCVVSEQMIPH